MAGPRVVWCALAVAAAALAGCSATPVPPEAAEQHIIAAEEHIAAGEWQEALDLLAQIAGDSCPKRLRDRRDLAIADAEYGRGERWRAFRALERFSDLYPHSDRRQQAIERIWTCGRELTASDRGFLFFWSDRTAGRTVLEHLVTRHPDTQRLADALRILGDLAFAAGDYVLAQQRFRDLMLNRPDSEWFVYAQFRFAMSIVASLQGPDYDLDRMQHAVRELRDFLATQPESPELVAQAQAAMQQLIEWQVERHLTIAGFYRTVGNLAGQRYHLQRATRDEFSGAEAYRRAMELRSALPTEPTGRAEN